MYGYVYKTTNLINGMIYIGQKSGTINLSYLGSGVYIQRALKRYGKKNFRLEIVAFATNQTMLDGLEMKYIYEYRQVFGKDFLYNIVDGGSEGQLKKGCPPPPHSFVKGHKTWNKGIKCPNISKSRRGFKMSEEQKEKLRLAHLGKKLSEDTKMKISKKFKGVPKSKEMRENLSKAVKGRMPSPAVMESFRKHNEQRRLEKLNNRDGG